MYEYIVICTSYQILNHNPGGKKLLAGPGIGNSLRFIQNGGRRGGGGEGRAAFLHLDSIFLVSPPRMYKT